MREYLKEAPCLMGQEWILVWYDLGVGFVGEKSSKRHEASLELDGYFGGWLDNAELALVVGVVVVVSLGVLVICLVLLGGSGRSRYGCGILYSCRSNGRDRPGTTRKEEVDGDNADETVNGVWVL